MVRALEIRQDATSPDERKGLPSASSFERIVFCAGSVAAETVCPPRTEEQEIAVRGSDIHEALETGDDEALKITDKIVKDRLVKTEEEALAGWLEEFGLKREEITIVRETRLWIRDRATLLPVASARVDFAAIHESSGRALVIDAKSGFLDSTPAELNWQLRVQAVALWHEYNFKVTDIRCAISQGRGKGKYDPVDYSIDSLLWAENQIRFYIQNAADEYAPRVPGTHCRYCLANGSCPQATSFTMIPAIITKAGPADKKTIELKVALLTPTQKAFIHSRAPLISAILDGVKDSLKGMLKDDLAAVGLEIKPNAPMRKIADVQLAYAALFERKLITDQEFRSICKLPVGAVEELIKPRIKDRMIMDGNKHASLEDAGQELNRILARTIEMVPKAGSLKPLKPAK